MRRLAAIISLALLVSLVAVPASAKPTDQTLDVAIAAKLTGQEKAQLMRADAPGQRKERLDTRAERLAAKLVKFEDKWSDGKPGNGRSIEVHAILAAGCNPGRGNGKKLGFPNTKFPTATCAVSSAFLPPGQDPFKVKEAEPDDD